MINIKPRILTKCGWCLRPIEENETVYFADTGGPEYGHVDVAKVFKSPGIRLEVGVDMPQLVFCRHCCEVSDRSAELDRCSRHELNEPGST